MSEQRVRIRDRRLRRVNQITAAGLLGGAALTATLAVTAADSYSGATSPTVPAPASPVMTADPPTAATPGATAPGAAAPDTAAPGTTAVTTSPTTAPRVTPPPTAAPSPRRHGAVSGGS